eukprot:9477547-Pyramimonas_sp.AAC.1
MGGRSPRPPARARPLTRCPREQVVPDMPGDPRGERRSVGRWPRGPAAAPARCPSGPAARW